MKSVLAIVGHLRVTEVNHAPAPRAPSAGFPASLLRKKPHEQDASRVEIAVRCGRSLIATRQCRDTGIAA